MEHILLSASRSRWPRPGATRGGPRHPPARGARSPLGSTTFTGRPAPVDRAAAVTPARAHRWIRPPPDHDRPHRSHRHRRHRGAAGPVRRCRSPRRPKGSPLEPIHHRHTVCHRFAHSPWPPLPPVRRTRTTPVRRSAVAPAPPLTHDPHTSTTEPARAKRSSMRQPCRVTTQHRR